MKLIIEQTISNAVEVEKKIAECIIAPFDTGVGAVPLTTVTAKGDLLAATGSGAIDNLPVGTDGDVLTADSSQSMGVKWSPVEAGAGLPCDGRLTLASATAVTITDQTAKTTIYFTPFRGNRIALYTDSVWRVNTFEELSCSLSGLTADKNYDVFVFKSGSTLKLALTVWTNDTTRATAIALKDGIPTNGAAMTPTAISSGIPGELAQYSARLVGTIRTTGTTGQCEDSKAKRYVNNIQNRIRKDFEIRDTTDSWAYTTAAWRSLNNSTANRISFVISLDEMLVEAQGITTISGGTGYIGFGLDKTNASDCRIWTIGSSFIPSQAFYSAYPGVGFHYMQMVEYGGAGATFYGDQGGIYQCGAVGWMEA